MTRSLFDAYLSGEARRFFGSHIADPEDRRRAVLRARRPLAAEVHATLVARNRRYFPSPAREANLARLRDGAAAVVTGQQVGLFLGPLYTLFKAATAIRLARKLSEETGVPVVPVFWLQTEDHDLPEIAETWVPTPAGPQPLRVSSSAEERVSIAHRALPPETADRLAELTDLLQNQPFAGEHLARLRRHYRPGAGWSDAFAGMLAELFADDGLVLVDPRDPSLAKAAIPVHRRAIEDAAHIAEVLGNRANELASGGDPVMVHIRPGAPLSFFHPTGIEGPRCRLEPDGAEFVEVGGTARHSKAELLSLLDADPLRFSTSALLRPILQDSLLPTAAYVGGPGEIAYFAQLSPLYEAFGMAMPLVAPRNRFRVIDPPTRTLLDRRGLSPADAALPEDVLLSRARRDAGDLTRSEIESTVREAVDAALAKLAPRLEEAGPELTRAIAKTRGKVGWASGKLASKYERVRLRSDRALLEDVRKLKEFLHPNDAPQERVFGMSAFAARFGERSFVRAVVEAADPLDFAARDLEP